MTTRGKNKLGLLRKVLEKDPVEIVVNYHLLLEVINEILNTTGATSQEICKVAGISISQLHRRKNKPSMWEKSELLALVRYYKPSDAAIPRNDIETKV